MPGPPPKRNPSRARDANRGGAWTSLPAAGRKGRTPGWPLPADARLAAQASRAERRAAAADDDEGRERFEVEAETLRAMLEHAETAEPELWRELWRTPQAVVWEQARSFREVAQYVRWKVRAETGDLEASKEARLLSDRLGLNPLAMLRLRLDIAKVDEQEDRGRSRKAATASPPAPPAGGVKDPRAALRAV